MKNKKLKLYLSLCEFPVTNKKTTFPSDHSYVTLPMLLPYTMSLNIVFVLSLSYKQFKAITSFSCDVISTFSRILL